MAIRECDPARLSLELPDLFRELDGLLEADLRAIVAMLTERARDRLYLTKRETHALQAKLWNGLAEAIESALEPLSIENR